MKSEVPLAVRALARWAALQLSLNTMLIVTYMNPVYYWIHVFEASPSKCFIYRSDNNSLENKAKKNRFRMTTAK